MKYLREPFDSGPYVAFLIERLYRRCGATQDAAGLRAFVETEWPTDGDAWAWTDDNAKIFEMLSQPDLWRAFPEQTEAALQFLEVMCEGPFIFRRIGQPRLERVRDDGAGRGLWIHSLMHVEADLPAGMLMLGIRFHDGRTARNLHLVGNYVSFRFGGELITIDVEESVTSVALEETADELIAKYACELRFFQGHLERRLGSLTYVYSVSAHSMVFGATATLDLDPEIEVEDVILTMGHDNLSHGANNVHYSRIGLLDSHGRSRFPAAAAAEMQAIPAAGVRYYSFAQDEMHGFALGIHSLPRPGAPLKELRVVRNPDGKLHWVVAAYEFAGRHRGARLTIGEDKLITAGGFYDELSPYHDLLTRVLHSGREEWPRDFSISYDYGVEINAFAKGYAAEAGAGGGAHSQLATRLRNLVDRFLAVYETQFVAQFRNGRNAVFSRQLAFVILAAATMLRATGEQIYRRQLAALVDIMLQFECPGAETAAGPEGGFLMGVHSSRDLHVDCHSAALLGLVRAAPLVDDPRISAAIDRGLNAYSLVSNVHEWLGQHNKIDTLGLRWTDGDGQPRVSDAFWNYHVGLTLRLLRALSETDYPPLVALRQKYGTRMETFEHLLLLQIDRSIRPREEGLEIRTSWLSSETNSETQPWVVLGLVGHPYD
jgi:hypothetical protein